MKIPDKHVTSNIDYGSFSVKDLAQDLSGTLSGAGGIGGLISVTRSTSTSTETFYPLCDGNGNICDYVDTNGNVAAHKEFDAYGNTIASSGAVNDFNFWFSSKYYDSEINAYYFGYREYLVNLARWGSRDPIGEQGGWNLYSFVGNESISHRDKLGLTRWDCCDDCTAGCESLVLPGGESYELKGALRYYSPHIAHVGPGLLRSISVVSALRLGGGIASGIAKSSLNSVLLSAATGGIGAGRTAGWNAQILAALGTIGSLLQQQEGIAIWVHVNWKQCERQRCFPRFWRHFYTWVDHDQWGRCSAGTSAPSGIGFDPSDATAIQNAIPECLREVVNNVVP